MNGNAKLGSVAALFLFPASRTRGIDTRGNQLGNRVRMQDAQILKHRREYRHTPALFCFLLRVKVKNLPRWHPVCRPRELAVAQHLTPKPIPNRPAEIVNLYAVENPVVLVVWIPDHIQRKGIRAQHAQLNAKGIVFRVGLRNLDNCFTFKLPATNRKIQDAD